MLASNFEYTGKKYPEYFTTPHWGNLKEQLLYSNRDARCWICGRLDTLLIHHVSYLNLFHEKLGKDVFILCFTCHTQVHFKRFLWIFNIKTPLREKDLVKRMRHLRIIKCIQKYDFIRATWYFMRYMLNR